MRYVQAVNKGQNVILPLWLALLKKNQKKLSLAFDAMMHSVIALNYTLF